MRQQIPPMLFVGYLESPTMQQNRTSEANSITGWIAALCGLAFVCGIVPAVGQAVSAFFWIVLGTVAVAAAVGWIVRRIRIHREDLEVERLAAIRRAEYAEQRTTTRPVRAA